MRRTARGSAAAALAALVLTVLAGPAHAAGTGGIEVTPTGAGDGNAFHVTVPSSGTQRVEFLVRNLSRDSRSARVYVASAERDATGAVSIGDPGSSPQVTMQDDGQLTLTGGQQRTASFTVSAGGHPGDRSKLAAVVVEVQTGAVVQRAATLVYLRDGRQVPLPVLMVAIAVGLLALGAIGVVAVGRRRRTGSGTGPAPAA